MATPRTKKAAAPAPAPAPKKESSAANRRYTEASRRLREKYSEEFYDILAAVWAEDGEEYKPRLSPADRARQKEFEKRQKAKEKLEALLAEHPGLYAEVKMDAAIDAVDAETGTQPFPIDA